MFLWASGRDARWTWWLTIVLVCGVSGRAHAFTDYRMFFADVASGGTAGRWFTGSPADGYTCSVCHAGGRAWPVSVTGLPSGGYLPGTANGSVAPMTYDITLSWNEFRAREIELLTANPAADPVMGLVVELISDDGTGSGTIEVAELERVSASEKCSRPEGKNAVDLWTVNGPMATPTKIRLRCESKDINQRCLVSVKGCGAAQLKLKWTAPTTWKGTIWFSAAFVGTEESSGHPEDDDGVTDVLIPLRPAAAVDGTAYPSRLDADCTVRPGANSTAAVVWIVGACGFWSWRRRSRR